MSTLNRADFRFIRKMSETFYGKFSPSKKQMEYISRKFTENGGSWEKIFIGSNEHTCRLKQVVKAVYKVVRSKSKQTTE